MDPLLSSFPRVQWRWIKCCLEKPFWSCAVKTFMTRWSVIALQRHLIAIRALPPHCLASCLDEPLSPHPLSQLCLQQGATLLGLEPAVVPVTSCAFPEAICRREGQVQPRGLRRCLVVSSRAPDGPKAQVPPLTCTYPQPRDAWKLQAICKSCWKWRMPWMHLSYLCTRSLCARCLRSSHTVDYIGFSNLGMTGRIVFMACFYTSDDLRKVFLAHLRGLQKRKGEGNGGSGSGNKTS